MATDCRDQEDSVVVLAGLGMSSGLLYSYDYSKIGKDVGVPDIMQLFPINYLHKFSLYESIH